MISYYGFADYLVRTPGDILLEVIMKRAAAVLSITLFWIGADPLVPTSADDSTDRPNVLFIAVDDLNTRIGCYGDPVAHTPNLNRLAQRGVRFERAYCQFPICNPSRVSLLLGRYPTTTEIIDFAHPALLGSDWVTLPQHFRNHGYDVRLLGKIFHFDKDLMKNWYPEAVPGDEYPPDWSAGEKWVERSQKEHRQMLADLTRWEPYRTLTPPPNNWVKSLRTSANVFGPVSQAVEQDTETRPRPYDWTADVRNSRDAVELLTRYASADTPFFLGVGFYKPHVPLVVPQRYFDLHPPEKMPLPSDFAPLPTAGDAVPRYALRYNLDLFFERPVTPEDAQQAIAAYYACVSFMDEKVGMLLDALDQLRLTDNTVILLWGDHGWHLGEKGMWAKGTLFDVSARAPLLIIDPRKSTAGRSCPRTVELVDVYPTLVELCGLPTPPGLEGQSLVPLLNDPSASWDHPAFTIVAREDWLARCVRTERWCYSEWDEGRRGLELYDLQADPREENNLAADPSLAATVAELSALLHAAPVAKPGPIHRGKDE
ncbi:MAG: sulfatase [Pirellulaceae bacterium]